MTGKKRLLGFTTVELMVVILTLLITGGLLWFNLEKGKKLQRDLSRKADLERVKRALQFYYHLHKAFPPSSDSFEILGCVGNQRWEDDEFIYLESLPVDPKTFAGFDWPGYGYQANNEDSHFWLWAFLEREDDPEINSSWEKCPGEWKENQYVVCDD
jgi:type II secretory pathway pseudopilin PulG